MSRVKRLDYKWVALSNTTLGMLIATINSSIILIALPDIFRGIHMDPLQPGNTSYLLWLILGFLVVMAVLLVSLGRLGDILRPRADVQPRLRGLHRLLDPALADLDARQLRRALADPDARRARRRRRAVFANSSAILTDAFPTDQRGLALGVNSIAAIAGSFIGLVLGGVLGPVSPGGSSSSSRYRWASSRRSGRTTACASSGVRKPARIDWWGNRTFAVGLVGVMVGITYGIQPYGGHTMGWTSPFVLTTMIGGSLFSPCSA